MTAEILYDKEKDAGISINHKQTKTKINWMIERVYHKSEWTKWCCSVYFLLLFGNLEWIRSFKFYIHVYCSQSSTGALHIFGDLPVP